MIDDDPFDQDAARRDYKRAARRRDTDERAIADAAYEAGREDGAQTSQSRPRSTAPRSIPGSVTKPVKRHSGSIAGMAVGLIFYALGLAAVREGPTGPARWIRAKFINQV